MSEELPFFYVKSSDDTILCFVIRAGYNAEKTTFFTPLDFSQQIGVIKYARGGKIKPHYHNRVSREVFYTQEVLFIRKGIVKVKLYDKELVFVQDIVLNTGDVILLASGGHGFEMLEDAELLEVKQGPYNGVENDKTIFEA